MLTAISRYERGSCRTPNNDRGLPGAWRIRQVRRSRSSNTLSSGAPAAARRSPPRRRITFYYMLKALDLPPGSEIIFPSLTFWVVPELARVAGLHVVFADVDPRTFNLDPDSVERLITDKTRAIVPTHLYGLPCDMDRILAIASRHNLVVLEDCAHALGATYKGRPVGTFGTGALFSFQTLKPLNCYGGGIACRSRAPRVRGSSGVGRAKRQRSLVRGQAPAHLRQAVGVLDLLVPGAVVSSLIGASPDVFLWEKIRSLHPLPGTERFPNVQAVIGLRRVAAARRLDRTGSGQCGLQTGRLAVPGVRVP